AEPDKARCFSHDFTYSGHPVACAAALKNIEIIEREGLLAHADKASKALFPESLNIGEWVHLRAQKRGLLVRPIVHLNVMSPP
ncbi:aspartate aminotransferase family protein, partial [Pseudomonas aeruginosa]|nr:aspartate aminotransferase family protein [Pseudomonas aeruginosa]